METEICSQNIVAQHIAAFQLSNGVFQTCYGVGILCSYIYVSVGRTYCIACQHHTFDQFIWITFHNGTVHKCPRVTFITVTYDIAVFFSLTCNLFPFLSGWEAAASTSAKTGFVNNINNLIGSHFEKCLLKGGKAAACKILVEGLSVKFAAVLQYNTCLLCDKRDFIRCFVRNTVLFVKEALYNIITLYAAFKDLFTVRNLYFGILYDFVAFLDTNKRSKFTDTLAACFLDAEMLAFVMRSKINGNAWFILCDFQKFFINLLGTCGNTAST